MKTAFPQSHHRLHLLHCLIITTLAVTPVVVRADVTFTGIVTPDPTSGNVSPNILNVGGPGGNGTVTVTNTGAPTSLTSGQALQPLPNPTQLVAASIFNGSVTVNGGSWFNNGAMNVGTGNGGNGTVTVQNGGTIISHGDLIGVSPGSFGAMLVESGGSWTANNFLTVGTSGTGSAIVQGGGQVITPILNIGINAGSTGTMLVTGAGSTVRGAGPSIGSLTVGSAGTGSMTFEQGGRFEGLFINVGRANGAVGTLNVDGTGSNVALSGDTTFMTVGREGGSQGTANITNGAQVTITSTTAAAIGFQAGRETGSNGVINVSGGASINVTGPQARVHIGRGGTGVLNLTDGGKTTLTGTGTAGAALNIGNNAVTGGASTGNGTVNVIGAGSVLKVQSSTGQATVNVGFNGNTGLLNVTNGGRVEAQEVRITATGSLMGNGTINALVTVNGGSIAPGNSPGTLTIDGDLVFNSGTLFTEIAGLNAGQFDVLDVNGTASFAAGTFAFSFIDGFLPASNSQWTFLTAANGISGWENLSLTVTGLDSSYSYFLSSDGSNLAFNVAIAPVPEPETYALMVAGLGFLGFTARRRKMRHTAA